MGTIKGLASVVSELRVERTNLVNQLKHVDAALSVLGKLNGGSSYTKPRHTLRQQLARRSAWRRKQGGRSERLRKAKQLE